MIFFSLNWKVKSFEAICENWNKFQKQWSLCVSNIAEKVCAHRARAISSWLTRWLCKRTLTAFNTREGWDSKPWPAKLSSCQIPYNRPNSANHALGLKSCSAGVMSADILTMVRLSAHWEVVSPLILISAVVACFFPIWAGKRLSVT